MTQVEAAATETYFADFTDLEQHSAPPAWLASRRKKAMERFADLGFPNTKQEAWRFTNVAPLARIPFRVQRTARSGLPRREFDRVLLRDTAARLVFVNGVFDAKLSSVANLPESVKVTSLATALNAETLERHLARYADAENHPFVALNTAFLDDGAFIDIRDGTVLKSPIHVVFVRTERAGETVTHPRMLVVAGREVEAQVIESHVGPPAEAYFTNAVTEVVVGENSSVDYLKLQKEGDAAFHVGTVQAHQERASRFHSHSISLGAALARHDVNTVLAGEGAECTLNGLYQVAGRQHVDHHTRLDHAMPHCSSREYYRGILDGKSSGVFSGAIIVRKDAQKTDAIQSNKNLLLSEDAIINTKPELQILADDVRCTHGATIGQLDPEAIFYLRARGIGYESARHLLTRAFANDVIARIRFAPVRERLEASLLARLSEGWKAQDVL
ncbi:MAG: Fe-S cluster assembly protein SufD [Terriglobia bacterium]